MSETIQLRPYQQNAIDALRQALKEGYNRPVLQAPTGAGKTVIAAAIVNMARQRGKRVIFAVPFLSLINQTVERFLQNGIFDVGVMQGMHGLTNPNMPVQVCSVQTLARREIPKSDLVIVDECQNVSNKQTEMIIGRLGINSKMIFCGDTSQIDLKSKKESGIGV